MKGSDKTLALIVGGVVLLLIIAFGLVLLRPAPEYRDDVDPDGAAHNYLLALQRADYERAYSYISESSNVGDTAKFCSVPAATKSANRRCAKLISTLSFSSAQ